RPRSSFGAALASRPSSGPSNDSSKQGTSATGPFTPTVWCFQSAGEEGPCFAPWLVLPPGRTRMTVDQGRRRAQSLVGGGPTSGERVMTYKTILVHCDASPTLTHRLGVAVDLAQRQGAHLVGVHVQPPFDVPAFFDGSMPTDDLYGAFEAAAKADQGTAVA